MNAVGDARKRNAEREGHYTHPDPSVRALIAKAQAEALREYAALCEARIKYLDARQRQRPTTADGREANVWGVAAYELKQRADRIEAAR